MAKGGLDIKILGGKKLDAILNKLDPNVSARIINASLKKAHIMAANEIRAKAPTAQNKVYKNPSKIGSRNPKNAGLTSRIHKRGTLRKSIQSRISGRARPNEKVFLASVFINDGSNDGNDGWYAHFVTRSTKGNYSGMPNKYRANNFMEKGAKAAAPKYKAIMAMEMTVKLTRAQQRMINKLNV